MRREAMLFQSNYPGIGLKIQNIEPDKIGNRNIITNDFMNLKFWLSKNFEPPLHETIWYHHV